MKIGVLAYQGSVLEHMTSIKSCGQTPIAVRLPQDLAGLNGLIIPGGESTTIGKLMKEYGLLKPLQKLAKDGFPIYGTCAGAILMAKKIIGSENNVSGNNGNNGSGRNENYGSGANGNYGFGANGNYREWMAKGQYDFGTKGNYGTGINGNYSLGIMDIAVKRNDYGRQVDSFETDVKIKNLGKFTATFIRAPAIHKAGKDVEVLAEFGGKPIMARQGNLLVSTFHPELNGDKRIHKMFIGMAKNYNVKN